MQKILDGLVECAGECRREGRKPVPILHGLCVIQPAQQALTLRMPILGPLQLFRVKLKLRAKDERRVPATFGANMSTAMTGPQWPSRIAGVLPTEAAHGGGSSQGGVAPW